MGLGRGRCVKEHDVMVHSGGQRAESVVYLSMNQKCT